MFDPTCSTGRGAPSKLLQHISSDHSLLQERQQNTRHASPAFQSSPLGASDQMLADQFFKDRSQKIDHLNARFAGVALRESARSPAQVAPDFAWAHEFEPGHQFEQPRQLPGHSEWAQEYRPQQVSSRMSYARPQFPMERPLRISPWTKGKERLVELSDKNWESQYAEIEAAVPDEQVEEAEQENLKYDAGTEELQAIWDDISRGGQYDDPAFNYEDFDPFAPPDLGSYLFEAENQFFGDVDPFLRGVEIMERGGNLSDAALAFEAAVQADEGRAEVWRYLGEAQAQNEKEGPAIRALERAMALSPDDTRVLMNLAVSYTNEGYDTAAYETLDRWLSITYPDIQAPKAVNNRTELHKRVTDLFIRAARIGGAQQFDSDVQVGLGVLFYGDEEYGRAVDCFEAAVQGRPDDHLLWNRMGATLANSGRSEEAIEAYHRALAIRPSFVRARYNLGVSCINIGCYEQAAGHLLGALEMHKSTDGRMGMDEVLQNQSTNLYETLRRVFVCMDRKDLVDKVGPGIDLRAFREFDF